MSFPGWNRRKSWKINYKYNGVHFKYYPYEKEYMGLQITKPEERFIVGKQSQFITQIWSCHRSLWQVHIFFTWNTYNWSWKVCIHRACVLNIYNTLWLISLWAKVLWTNSVTYIYIYFLLLLVSLKKRDNIANIWKRTNYKLNTKTA